MTHRGDLARIYQAQRAGILMRLVNAERLDRFDAEQWITAWERHAAEAELVFDWRHLLGRGVGVDRGSAQTLTLAASLAASRSADPGYSTPI